MHFQLAECEAAGIKMSASMCEPMVLGRKSVAYPLQVNGELKPQVDERMEQQIGVAT